MRIQLTLQHLPETKVDFNYQYQVSSWIYKTLAQADGDFAEWLHQQGYVYGKRAYRLFTFGKLHPRRYSIDQKNRMLVLLENTSTLTLSFYVPETMQHFVTGLFEQQRFRLGSLRYAVDFEVQMVRILPPPLFKETMRYRCESPMLISKQVEGNPYPQYLAPDAPDYASLLLQNLLRKWRAWQKVTALSNETPLEESLPSGVPFGFSLLSTPRSKLLRVKKTELRGYEFSFELTAPIELHEIGYYAGFGEKNAAAGMGMVQVVRDGNTQARKNTVL